MEYIRLNKIVFLLIITCFVLGCFSPKPVQETEEECELVTRKLTLEYPEKETVLTVSSIGSGVGACSTPECLLVSLGILAIPAGSFIASGSIVVIGNTIHWIEIQGRCEDSATRAAINDFITGITKAGGKVIRTKKEIINWLKTFPN